MSFGVGKQLATNRKDQRNWFEKCRRESWCAGEEKEEGLLRYFDCVFKSCLLIAFSRVDCRLLICVHHAASKGAAADLWLTASSADLRFCFSFSNYVIICVGGGGWVGGWDL